MAEITRLEWFELLRKTVPDSIARQICDVQPMPDDVYKKLYDAVKAFEETQRELRASETEETRMQRVNDLAWDRMKNQIGKRGIEL